MLEDGTYIHHNYAYILKKIRTCVSSAGGDVIRDWESRTWKETLRFIRANYARYDGTECEYIHRTFGPRNEIVHRIGCVASTKHVHCARCEVACMPLGTTPDLCFDCHTEVREWRQTITAQIVQFEDRFGLPFTEDKAIRDEFEGNNDDDRECGACK